jgi:hypothetical protein
MSMQIEVPRLKEKKTLKKRRGKTIFGSLLVFGTRVLVFAMSSCQACEEMIKNATSNGSDLVPPRHKIWSFYSAERAGEKYRHIRVINVSQSNLFLTKSIP